MNRYPRKKFGKYKKRSTQHVCPICDKPLYVLTTAIIHKETKKKAHFDCVINELKKFYHVNPKEEIYYLGGGVFGIIEKTIENSYKGFIIKRRIQYEER